MNDHTGQAGKPASGTPAVRETRRQARQPGDLAEFKRRARAGWAAGDYASIAERELWPLCQRIVARAAVRPGEEVLDVGCGTGNAAIRAAQAGARAVGVDPTPELFGAGRRLAAGAGVEVEWIEGDAEALPFADGTFDVVVSVLGVMFAPRHQAAADELVRVLRPGGRLALICCWTPGSAISRVFGTIARYLPPPPPSAAPPVLWGSEDHVRSLFAGTPIDIEFEHGTAEFPPFESAEADLEYRLARFGPLMQARALTEADGRWPALRAELLALHEGLTAAGYLVMLGRKRRPAA
ncbi:MAG TPA: class I SAM-dependent methyltransferase [Streptosporangiaceae bacterium]|nr:class I SAM-dependent methyltransferase [Streptosporangiaceae bacterium]